MWVWRAKFWMSCWQFLLLLFWLSAKYTPLSVWLGSAYVNILFLLFHIIISCIIFLLTSLSETNYRRSIWATSIFIRSLGSSVFLRDEYQHQMCFWVLCYLCFREILWPSALKNVSCCAVYTLKILMDVDVIFHFNVSNATGW